MLAQLFPESQIPSQKPKQLLFDLTNEAKKREENIQRMQLEISSKNLLPILTDSNRGLVNVFSGTKATPEQSHDLLTFRKVGMKDIKNFVLHRILRHPSSSQAPVRKHKLLTMAPARIGKRRISQKEKEQKRITKCLRRRLAWCNSTGRSYDLSQEQYSLLPRALADCDGNPNKGSKAAWTKKLSDRYSSVPVLTEQLPEGWTPDAVMVDAMFTINTTPLKHTQIY